MGLGILDDRHMEMPPGTARLESKFDASFAAISEDGNVLKMDGDMVLIPQPTDDPNDPLSWSPLWKNSIMFILGIAVAVTLSLGPMITPGLVILSKTYDVSIDRVSSIMVGSLAFSSGFTTFFVASGATIWGKRAFFVLSMIFLLVTCVWGYVTRSFTSLTVMRIIQGIATAPIETLVTPTVTDLFFIHQRGSRIAIWHMMISGGVGLGQVISGFIIQNLGVEATFGICALWYVLLIPLMYFFVLETSYTRKPPAWDPQQTESGASNILVGLSKEGNMTSEAKTIVETVRYIDQSSAAVPAKIPYQKRLRLFNGRMSHDSFWKGVVKPIPLICYPAVLFSTVINGFHFASMVGMSLVLLTVLHAKPYDLDPSQIGMTNIPHLIVSFIFAPISGFLADWIAKSLSRRNKGIFEPEFRLLLMIIVVPIATIAFIGLGIVVEQKKSLAHILVFSSLQAVSVPFASQAALTYVLDSHPRDSNQAFVTVNFVKTLLIFLFTSKISGWYESAGPRKLFNTLAAINLLLSCLTIPFYMYGKRFRSRVARSKLAQKMEMR